MSAPEYIPPIIVELFKLLPPPGSEFDLVERMRWLRAAEAIFGLLYKPDDAQLVIEAARDDALKGAAS